MAQVRAPQNEGGIGTLETNLGFAGGFGGSPSAFCRHPLENSQVFLLNTPNCRFSSTLKRRSTVTSKRLVCPLMVEPSKIMFLIQTSTSHRRKCHGLGTTA